MYYLGVPLQPTESALATAKAFGALLFAQTLVALASSVLALSAFSTGVGIGILAGVLYPLLGFYAISRSSQFALSFFAVIVAVAAVSGITTIITLHAIAGDPVTCICAPACAADLGQSFDASAYVCRHKTLARWSFYISEALAICMIGLQAASVYFAAVLSGDASFFATAEIPLVPLLDPLAGTPPARSPIVRRTAGS